MRLRLIPLLAVLARTALAQGSVQGAVHDSLANAPLSGARVQLVGTGDHADFIKSAQTDSLGRFSIPDVPSGRYAIGFVHPLLDSLGVQSPLRAVDVADQPTRVTLAVPSGARLRAAICGKGSDSSGVLVGTVRNASDHAPRPKVSVTGEWMEVVFQPGGIVRRVPRLTATTDDNGWFALCNVPVGGSMFVVATAGADSTDMVELQVPASGFVRRELYLGNARTTVSRDTAKGDSAATLHRFRSGTGRVSGVIVANANGQPLANAQVRITDGPGARTNDRGEWTIDNAPEGTRTLEVRAVGYYPERRAVNVVADAPRVRVAMSTFKAVLDTVRVSAQRLNRDEGGFLARQKAGAGRFISERDVALRNPLFTSDLFRNLPGIRFSIDTTGDRIIQMRGAMEEWCSPTFYVDGVYMPGITPGDIDAMVNTKSIRGIEVHRETSLPPQYNRFDGCGAVLIWTH